MSDKDTAFIAKLDQILMAAREVCDATCSTDKKIQAQRRRIAKEAVEMGYMEGTKDPLKQIRNIVNLLKIHPEFKSNKWITLLDLLTAQPIMMKNNVGTFTIAAMFLQNNNRFVGQTFAFT